MSFHDHRRPRIAAVLPAAKQLGPVTLAIRTMRAAYALGPKAPNRQTGPITEAIRVMRATLPDFDANPDLIALRRALANRIEKDIAALDMLGGDPDLEPSLAAPEPVITGNWGNCSHSDQAHWAAGGTDDREDDAGDNREEENEHGGDIQDERHDEEPDREPDAEGEPSLGSLGGTAAGCHDSQKIWGNGDKSDREISPPSASHQRELIHRESGQALTAAREQVRRIRDRQHVRVIAGPDGRQYHCIALRMS